MTPNLLPGDSAALPGGSSGNMNASVPVNGSNHAGCEGVACGHNFTTAQLALQMQIIQCNLHGMSDIETALRGQLDRSIRGRKGANFP